MTLEDVKALRKVEEIKLNMQLNMLEQIVSAIEKMRAALGDDGDDAVEWVLEKLAE